MACDIYINLLKDTDKIYEEEKVYKTITSNLKYDKFGTVYRNKLASFIYKFIDDYDLHNEFYRELMKWLKRNDLDDCENFKLALLKSLKNLYPDLVIAESECFDLTKNNHIFECDNIIEIISYAYRILTCYDRNQTVLCLLSLKQNFSFEKF